MSKARDVSEVERLREQLREAQETLSAIRNGEVDALVIAGPQGDQVYTLRGADYAARMLLQEMSEGAATLIPDGTVLYCNKRLAEMLCLPHEKIIGAAAHEFLAPADRPAYEALIRDARTSLAKAELTLIAANGTSVPTYCAVNSISVGDEPCLCMVVTDLREQKRTEEILAAAALTNSIFDQAAEIIVVCDLSGTIIRASQKAHEFWGRTVLHESFKEVFSLDSTVGPGLNDSTGLPNGFLTGEPLHGIEVNLRHSDGRRRSMLMSAGPLRNKSDSPIGCVVTLSDISDLKETEKKLRDSEQRLREQAQELEQQLIASGRLVSLGEITASMAHEFNNPLGIIMGFVDEMLSTTDPDSPDFQSLQIIDDEAKRCQKLIKDLMEFARPSPTTSERTEIGSLIARTGKLIEARCHKQNVMFAESIAPDLPDVKGDPQQIEQVLLNLCLNALDVMLGGGQLSLEANCDHNAAGSEIVITVADTGPGIARDHLPKIFQPFFTAGKKAGMGLGLPICERIVKNHGGRIEVESEPNKGTTFRIRLPIKRSA